MQRARAPTEHQARTIKTMHRDRFTQASAAAYLGVPLSTIKIWYRRFGLAPLSRSEGAARGRADAKALR